MKKRWIVAVTLGLSLAAMACSRREEPSGVTREPLARATAVVPVAAAPASSAVAAAPEPKAVEKIPALEREPKRAPKVEPTLTGAALAVKRLVVTRSIEQREPVVADQLSAGDEPLYAFVEVANPTGVAQGIVISFESAGKSVGHIKLEVPAKNGRWRTWGKTRQVTRGGDWVAVVKTSDGKELGRTRFVLE